MRLAVTFEETRSEFVVGLEEDEELRVDMEEAIPGGEADIYDGDYEVTPDFSTQTLETATKVMLEDVTVHPIPVYRTTNPTGGNTVYIGGEIDG